SRAITTLFPYTTLFRSSKSVDKPDRSKYFVTTFDPGARLVLTQDRVRSPFSTAFLATSPAPIITLGFEVFVQLVIAAITILPSRSEEHTSELQSRENLV